jgi:hypothetical protein
MSSSVDEPQTDALVRWEDKLRQIELRFLVTLSSAAGERTIVDARAVDETGLRRRCDESLQEAQRSKSDCSPDGTRPETHLVVAVRREESIDDHVARVVIPVLKKHNL